MKIIAAAIFVFILVSCEDGPAGFNHDPETVTIEVSFNHQYGHVMSGYDVEVYFGIESIYPFDSEGRMRSYPNPVRGECLFEIELERPQEISLEMTSPGRNINKRISSGKYPPGRHIISHDFRGYPVGIYKVFLRKDRHITESVVIWRDNDIDDGYNHFWAMDIPVASAVTDENGRFGLPRGIFEFCGDTVLIQNENGEIVNIQKVQQRVIFHFYGKGEWDRHYGYIHEAGLLLFKNVYELKIGT